MEPVALLFLTLVAMTTIGWLLLTFREALTDIARALGLDYVKPAIRQLIEPRPVNPQSYAVNQSQTAPVETPKPRFEPRFTKRELVQFLATTTLVEDDGTTHPLSQEAISRAAGISKVTAAVMIAEARGETVRATDPYQFEPVNGNVNMSRRTGVKPLR